MKTTIITLTLLLIHFGTLKSQTQITDSVTIASAINFDWKKNIKLNGLPISNISKKQISHKIGTPLEVTTPNYDCGFLSSSETGNTYYCLQYIGFWFTGNDTEGYILEELDFTKSNAVVTFNEKIVTKNTTIVQLGAILSENITLGKNNEIILKFNTDDNYHLVFKDNKLLKMYYWSPC